ncbi:putative DASH complex subunit Dam1 protein [Septoria linicola]|nr:putative DASH complex subunit Dam1 protein [Septoria linicola]
MASTSTPGTDSAHHRSASHSRTRSGAIPSRPTTPLRPPSRTSLRASQTTPTAGNSVGNDSHPLSSIEPAFGELSDAMADLEANMMHLQLLNDSISRFNENFGAFLYGMNMTAFCVDFPEAPIQQSYARHKGEYNPLDDSPFRMEEKRGREGDIEATFMTSDTSGFVDNPEPSTIKKSTVSSKFSSVPGSMSKPSQFNARGGRGAAARGSIGTTRATAAAGRARGSGIARGTSSSRGTAGTRGSGIARGVGRGRGVR